MSRPTRTRRAADVGFVLALTLVVGACAGTGPRSTPTGPDAGAATPAPAVQPPSASLAIDHHEVAIAAFVDRVTGGDLTYRVKFDGQVAASVDVLPIAGSMDVNGGDFASSWTYDFDPEYAGVGKKKVQVRGVGNKGWIKRGAGAWKATRGYGVEDSYVPFKAVKTIDDVTYVGTAKDDGATRYRVTIPGSLLIHPGTIPYQIQKEKVDSSTLEVLLDEQGRPWTGTWHGVGQARVGEGVGQLQRIVYDLDLRFSKVGDKIRIKRP